MRYHRLIAVVAFAAVAACAAVPMAAFAETSGVADASDAVEKDAFEAAKELGTTDAWQAFVANYPTGFRADLARAYMKKLGGSQPAAAAPEPGQVTSINVTRAVYNLGQFVKNGSSASWVEEGQNGARFYFEEFSRTQYGVELLDRSRGVYLTLDVGANTIWTSDNGAPRKKLYDIIGTSADPQTASPPPPAPRTAQPQYAPKPSTTVAKACPKNYARNPAGKCVWKTNRNGFEVDPWKKPGCSTWQAQCNQGNATSCLKYESTCQVN